MFSARLIRQFKLPRTRQLNSTHSLKNDKALPDTQSSKPSIQETSTDPNKLGQNMHNVSNFDKRLLVWVKRYPSMDQVPGQVSVDCILKAHSKARIKVCNYMIAFAVLGFLTTAIMGRKDAAAGKHVMTDRIKWHNEVIEKREAEAAAAKGL